MSVRSLPAAGGRGGGAPATGRPLPRPWGGPLGTYRPGTTPLHRAPAGAKLAALAAFSLVVAVAPGPVAAAAGALAAAVLAASLRVRWRTWWGAFALALVVGLGRAWTGSPAAGLAAGLDVLALVLACAAVTASTRSDEVLDLLPGRVGLAAVLMIRAVPTLVGTLAATREAARARGCERDPRTWLTPAAVRAVARAHATGEALAARGLAD